MHQNSEEELVNRMRSALKQYSQLKQYQGGEDSFVASLHGLQHWQADRLKRTHADALDDDARKKALNFILEELYAGVDLSSMIPAIERVTPMAGKVFPKSVLEAATWALELNALTGRLDEAMAERLQEGSLKHQVLEINEANYNQAMIDCDQYEDRIQQIELCQKLGKGLNQHVRKKTVLATFKLAKWPAQAAGLGELYEFMAHGFDALRSLDDPEALIFEVTEGERKLLNKRFSLG